MARTATGLAAVDPQRGLRLEHYGVQHNNIAASTRTSILDPAQARAADPQRPGRDRNKSAAGGFWKPRWGTYSPASALPMTVRQRRDSIRAATASATSATWKRHLQRQLQSSASALSAIPAAPTMQPATRQSLTIISAPGAIDRPSICPGGTPPHGSEH